MVIKVKSRTILHPLTFTYPLMSLFVTVSECLSESAI